MGASQSCNSQGKPHFLGLSAAQFALHSNKEDFMRRFTAGLYCLVILAATAAAQAPASWPKVWNLTHPNAAALIGIDVRGIRESALGKSLGDQLKTAGAALPAALPNVQGRELLPGKEFFNDIDRVLISSPGSPKPAAKTATAKPVAGKPPAAKDNPPFLMILTGHFPVEHLQTLLKGESHVYDTVDVYRPDPHGNSSVARLDENTLLFGDTASVRGAIDRRNLTPKTPSPLLARAAAMAAANDFWIIATVPPSAFQPSNVNLGAMTSDINGLELGMAFRDGFKLELSLATNSPEAAQRFAQMLTAQMKLGMAGKVNAQQAAEMMRKLQITTDGNKVSFRVEASREEVERKIQEMRKSPSFGLAGRRPAPAPPAPGTLKVYGMEGGVREIPAEPPKQP